MLHIHTNVLSIDDLKQFRQYGSKTAGHPEHHLVPAIDVTTGPLGQGISNAVGLSVASHYLAARFNKPDIQIFTNKVWCIASDGDMMEGVQAEAASFAGHQKLDNLIVFWDNNKVTIDGHTDIAFTENVPMRYRAYGWHTISVKNADTDFKGIESAIIEALQVKDKPVLIELNTTIGFGSDVADTPKVHGTPLNKEQLANIKKKFGFNPDEFFTVPQAVYDHYAKVRARTHKKVEEWNTKYAQYASKYPEDYKVLQSIINGNFTLEEFQKFMPKVNEKNVGTRVTSGLVLNVLAKNLPGLIGGSADLTPSNNTALDGEKTFKPGVRDGRYIEFGIREHGMQAIANGIQYYGFKGLVPFTATFFVFFQYLLPSIRVAALESLREIIILTHDSIGVGEDGPTHQPVESLAMLRALPNINVFRPADQLEVSACYTAGLTGPSRPSIFVLSRQNAPPLEGSSFEGALKGGYVVKKVENPKLVIVGTGTEVNLALKTAELLPFPVQVVSLPCMEIYNTQSKEYKRSVFPKDVPVLSVEAACSFGWERYSHKHVGVDTFGLSAPANKVYEHFGLVPEKVAEKAKQLVDFYSKYPVPELVERI
ncbi:transketolase family protein [Tritrichomonas foetus]|uniref:transketolase n=1 Tax=Tritrichomonas foetus TaxID=1144522 RepID=A0A1J4K2J9_9EUKA|nr:transketolase family protein [Tritrichomonas foetus]|eukprot:OHT05615.1 transketolase family protein [Tritrichomonas foetus]